MIQRIIGLFILVMILTSCFEKDTPITPFPRGDVQELSMELGPKYTHQLFYNFATNSIVKSVIRTDWDISFSSENGNPTIRLNGGNNAYAAITDQTELSAISDTAGLEFKWDWSNGRDDSTALYGWETSNSVVVFNLGNNVDNKHQGFIKAKLSIRNDSLVMNYSYIGETEKHDAVIGKVDGYNQVYYSFVQHQVVDIEPRKELYDLQFRQYIYYFEAEELPYSVVGALVNPYNTRVMSITDKDFADISISDTAQYEFSPNQDVIGYDWKEFNLNEGFYVVYPEKNWIIQTSEGFFYKFHFVDFYNTEGDRGYPKIEFKLL